MADVKIRNSSLRKLTFNLEHPTFVSAQGDNGVGKPESLTFLPLEVKVVDSDALQCVQVASALKGKAGGPGVLRIMS